VSVQPCPICAQELPADPRYPRKLCGTCSALAVDESGRRLRFGNTTPLAAGFMAEVHVDGVWRPRENGECWVRGWHCVADEHRFGGIVIQTVKD
jgi:hypothetical protein